MKSHILVLSSLILILALLGSSQAQATSGQARSLPLSGEPDRLVFTLDVPPMQITQDEAGFAQAQLEGYKASGSPGDPLLPARAYRIALPPDVIPESVKANVIQAKTVEQPGVYTLAPAQPGVTWVEEREVIQWGKNADSIVDGKNTQVYQNDVYFPQSQLSSVRFDQMRKWRFVSLLVTPLQYNPVTGKLRLAKQVQIEVNFERATSVDERQRQIELSDTVMDERAAELLYNYEQARTWYPVMQRPEAPTDTYDYVILTSNKIVAASQKLNSFIVHKQDQGYNVLVVTENQYGGLPGLWPHRLAQKIRQWLYDNYQVLSIEYVLLIGDPTAFDPDNPTASVGDVPMRMCWPWRRTLDKYGNPSGENIPTDMLYADLTGNWDKNSQGQNDEYCGELTDDDGDGGMNFQPDVYVGRIPVYYQSPGWVAALDSILEKTIIYEDSGDLTWRKRALLPMSFSDDITDGAYLAEAMKSNYLNAAGYSSYTLYQHDGPGCYSTFASSQDLKSLAVPNRWKSVDYGLVTWWAHGGWDGAGIGYGNGSCSGGNLFTSADASALDDSRPAIVFTVSCYNGHPDYRYNLGYSLLKQGAVATITSSMMSGYSHGNFSSGEAGPDNAHLGYHVMRRIVNGETVGHALYDQKFELSGVVYWDQTSVGNWLNFNLYGDPSLSINDGHPWAPAAPGNLTAASNATQGIDLTWTDNSDNELGFVIERTTNPSIAWMQVATVGVNTTSWSDSEPSCGSHYYYRVQAYNAYSGSAWSNQADAWSLKLDNYEIDDTYLNARSIATGGSYAGGQAHTFHIAGDVDWIKFHTTWGKSYTIRTYDLGASNDTKLDLYYIDGVTLLTSNDNCTTGDPVSCITNWAATSTGDYYVKISHAGSEGGCSGYEYNVMVQEGGAANWPPQPTALETIPVSHCQINLGWIDNSTNETGFEIERWNWKSYGSVGMMMWQQIATVGPSVTSYSNTGLDCNKSYNYRVRAYNANGKSLYSNESQSVTFTADTFETDNTFAAASTIATDGTPQLHNFHVVGDEDWSKFSAAAGWTYTITTSYLGNANDTFLALYDKNGATLLEWNDDCGGLASCIKSWTAPSNGAYYIKVRHYNGQGGCPGYQYTLAVTRTALSASLKPPSGLWIANPSVSSLQVAWPDDITGGDHAFEVQRRIWITGTLGLWRQVGIAGPGIIYLARPSDGTSSLFDTGLACNTTYDYRVRAFDASGPSAFSDVISGTTLLTDTYEPDDDYTQAHTLDVDSGVQYHNLAPALDYDWVSFTAVAGEVYTVTTSQFTHSDNYTPTLELYGNPPGAALASTQQCGADQRALCLNGWVAPTSGTYYIRVSGQGGCPGHDYALGIVDSHISSFWPIAPTGFTAIVIAPDQIRLSWTDNSNNEVGFRLERQVGLGWVQVANMTYNVMSYTDAGLSCGQPYTYRIYAYNASGNSSYATLTISTPGCGYPVIYLPVLMIR